MTLWVCSRGFWTCVVLAADEDTARTRAKQIWEREEGYGSDEEWSIMQSDDPDAALIGWT